MKTVAASQPLLQLIPKVQKKCLQCIEITVCRRPLTVVRRSLLHFPVPVFSPQIRSKVRSMAADLAIPDAAVGPAEADEDRNSFTDFHLAQALDKCYSSWPEADALLQKCLGQDPAAFAGVLGGRPPAKLAALLALARCRPTPCWTAADLLLWLVDRRVVKRADLAPWRAVYKGQTARDVAERVIARFRPEESGGASDGDGDGDGGDSDIALDAACAVSSFRPAAFYTCAAQLPESCRLGQGGEAAGEPVVLSHKAEAFLRGMSNVDRGPSSVRSGRAVGRGKILEVLGALSREPQDAEGGRRERGAAGRPGAFREGHDDEYELMVGVEYMVYQGLDCDKARAIMPDLARYARGLVAPLAVPLQNSGCGTVCCDVAELGRQLQAALGVSLMKSDAADLPFSLRLTEDAVEAALGGDSEYDAQGWPIPLDTDGHSLLRVLTAYREHHATGLPLFLEACCVCRKAMQDPASLSCGHSACSR
jgi:hypothetical protein